MNKILVVFASNTSANRIKSILKKKLNIYCEIIQTPSALELKSCSYSIKTDECFIDTVWNLVCKSGLSSGGVFRERDLVKLR